MMNDLKKSGKWKINLTTKMIFMLSEGTDEKLLVHSKTNNEELMAVFNTGEVIVELF